LTSGTAETLVARAARSARRARQARRARRERWLVEGPEVKPVATNELQQQCQAGRRKKRADAYASSETVP
jgi:hypothetical protein